MPHFLGSAAKSDSAHMNFSDKMEICVVSGCYNRELDCFCITKTPEKQRNPYGQCKKSHSDNDIHRAILPR